MRILYHVISQFIIISVTTWYAYADAVKLSQVKWQNLNVIPMANYDILPNPAPYEKFCGYSDAMRKEYLETLRIKAADNDSESAMKYGAITIFSKCEKITLSRAKSYLVRASQGGGNPESLYLLGLLSLNNKTPQDKITAREYFDVAIKNGYTDLNYAYTQTLNMPTDSVQYEALMNKAVSDGDLRAKHDLTLYQLKTVKQPAQLFSLESNLKYIYKNTQQMPLKALAAYNLGIMWKNYAILRAKPQEIDMVMGYAQKNGIFKSENNSDINMPVPVEKPSENLIENNTDKVNGDTVNTPSDLKALGGIKNLSQKASVNATNNDVPDAVNQAYNDMKQDFNTWHDQHAVNPIGGIY